MPKDLLTQPTSRDLLANAKLPNRSLWERFKSSFGSEDVRKRAKEREISEGRSGFQVKDIPGDIADVAGDTLSMGGMILGSASGGGIIGAGIGAGAGEFVRESIGKEFGVNEITPSKIAQEAIIGSISEGAGKIIGWAADKTVSKAVAPLFRKFSALSPDDIALLKVISQPGGMKGIKQTIKRGGGEAKILREILEDMNLSKGVREVTVKTVRGIGKDVMDLFTNKLTANQAVKRIIPYAIDYAIPGFGYQVVGIKTGETILKNKKLSAYALLKIMQTAGIFRDVVKPSEYLFERYAITPVAQRLIFKGMFESIYENIK